MAFGDLARLDEYEPGGFKDTFAERFGAAPRDAAEVAAQRLQRSVRRPSETSQETIDKLTGAASDVFIPKTPLDWGLTAATLPAGPLARPAARVGALALGALFEPSEAQGGVLSKIAKGIRAYHGSPHDFDRFDLSKIGTGEGAQAYGHGLYFAENEKVAKGYRDLLATPRNDAPVTISDDVMAKFLRSEPDPRVQREIKEYLDGTGYPNDLRRIVNQHGSPQLQQYLEPQFMAQSPGRMYEVSLNARPEQFLDWDKSLNAQDPAHRAQLLRMSPNFAFGGDRPLGFFANEPLKNPKHTETLREAGIPGIRYLDQGSRGLPQQQHALKEAKALLAGAEMHGDPAWIAKQQAKVAHIEKMMLEPQTSNYVVFDPGIIDILRKYGLAGATAAPLGALAAQDSYKQ